MPGVGLVATRAGALAAAIEAALASKATAGSAATAIDSGAEIAAAGLEIEMQEAAEGMCLVGAKFSTLCSVSSYDHTVDTLVASSPEAVATYYPRTAPPNTLATSHVCLFFKKKKTNKKKPNMCSPLH
jgi:hypothetical protein